jgi:hypothetical protein
MRALAVPALAVSLLAGCEATPEPAREVVHLEQGWGEAERALFHYTPQGTEIMPAAASSDPGVNPHGLPVGFTVHRHDAPAETCRGVRMASFTCAACHTGQIDHAGRSIVIEDGAAMHDAVAFQRAMARAMILTAELPWKRARSAAPAPGQFRARARHRRDRAHAAQAAPAALARARARRDRPRARPPGQGAVRAALRRLPCGAGLARQPQPAGVARAGGAARADRPAAIVAGDRACDPVKLGYRTGRPERGTVPATTLIGNNSQDHWFRHGDGPGIIGPAPAEDERRARIEYLKSASSADCPVRAIDRPRPVPCGDDPAWAMR